MGKFSPLQPPPSLPRRGGTVTIDYLIICRRLIISHLSANGVIFISPTGENERGLKMITGIIHLHLKSAFVMSLVIVVAKNHEQMCDVCRSLAVGECWLLEKSLQKCSKCPTVPLSQVESCILYKLLYINILSFLLHFLLLIWDSGTVGHLGHLVLFSSLFTLSCHLLDVHVCHVSGHCICNIYMNRGVKFAVVWLSENVWPFEKSL